MPDELLKAVLDDLVPRRSSTYADRGWKDVQRRVRRRRFRRRSLLAATVLCTTLFSTLAAAGEIGSFVSHSKAPHLVVRATLHTENGGRAGSLEIELERATIAFGRRVRVMRWRLPSDHRFRARWFLDLDSTLGSGSLVVGGATHQLCGPCGARSSGERELSPAEAAALVNDEVTFSGKGAHATVVSGAVRLDRSHLQRGVMCVQGAAACTRIYTGRP